MSAFNPIEAFANYRHAFGEHGGVNMSVEESTTFTVMNPTTMPEIFQGGNSLAAQSMAAVTIVIRVNTSPAFAPNALEPPIPPSAPANPPPRPRCTICCATR